MRISDWSSDVCSSDLAPPRCSAGRRADLGGLSAAPAPCPQDSGRDRLSPSRATPGDGPNPWRGRPDQRQLENVCRRDADPIPWFRAASFRIGLNPRSEEHTSELQSLMRISYALFCLKTQNTSTQS